MNETETALRRPGTLPVGNIDLSAPPRQLVSDENAEIVFRAVTTGEIRRFDLVRQLRAAKAEIVARWYDNQFAPERLARYGVDGLEGIEPTVTLEEFLGPLVELLLACLETGEPRYRDLYLDERLRYAPHRADAGVRRAFFEEMLPSDEGAMAAVIEGLEAREVLLTALAGVHAPLVDPLSRDTIRLLAVGDCLLNEVRVFLRTRCAVRKTPVDMRCVYFSASLGQDLSTAGIESLMSSTPFDMLAFSFFTYEGLPPFTALLRDADRLSPAERDTRVQQLLGLVHGYLGHLRQKTEAPFILHNVSGLPLDGYRRRLFFLPALSRGVRAVVESLNRGLRELVDAIPNVILLDEHAVGQKLGLRTASESAVPPRLQKKTYFHTTRFGEPVADAYADIIESYRDLRKAKVLLVDFDNTLWDGVMADGPVRQRREAQELLKKLKDAGMILVALSKNDEKNIRWDEMVLKQDDFAVLKINWNLKAQSVQETAAELDLGIDSFVMIDDSAQERALVGSSHPSVRLLDSMAPATWVSLERLLRFPNTRETEESRARTEMYRAQAQRRRAQNGSAGTGSDYASLMGSLDLKVKFGRAQRADLDRLTELVQRTNQFNTTTIRYTRSDLDGFLADSARAVYVAELVDRFGGFGLVAVAILSRSGTGTSVDSMVMSCRAMGFGLEQAVLRLVIDQEGTAVPITGRFVPTDRNAPSARVFADNGFRQTSESEWLLEPSNAPAVPSWIEVERRG